MKLNKIGRIKCDVLVIGGGGAGLRAAIESRLAGARVLLVSKSRVGYANNTYISKAGIGVAGWGDARDGGKVHLKDTVLGGKDLNDRRLVSLMAERAREEISVLEKFGVVFQKNEEGFILDWIPGHSFPRHVRGEHQKGSDLTLPLRQYAEKIGVRFMEHLFVTRLFSVNDRVAAATGVSQDGRFLAIKAGSVILATGGFGQMYLHTNNAAGITGDGQALAFELGLPLKDMEFVQFYPTAGGRFGNRVILSEILVMAEGAILRNNGGEDIAKKHGVTDPMALTRDLLSRIIMDELMAGRDMDGGVIMDLSPIPEERLPLMTPLLPAAWDSSQKTLVVSPTTHFCMGGIVIDENSETPLSGLFAAGEVTAGIHGANRLGGNALCEIFTFGGIAGERAAARAEALGIQDPPDQLIRQEKARLESFFDKNGERPKDLCQSLKETMWLEAGILREPKGLNHALETIGTLKERAKKASVGKVSDLIRRLELDNMLMLAEVVSRAALMRTESRGSHFRTDYPLEDNEYWLKNIIVRKADEELFYEKSSIS